MLNRERRREQLFRQGEDPGEPTRLRTILEQMDDRSVELICYSPFYRRYLPGYLAPACIRRMIFLHHPFVQHAVTPTRHENAGLRIGVYAAAANDNACQVVRAVAERDPAGAVSFALLGGKQNPLEKEPSVERVLPGQRLSAGDIDRFVAGCDFILVPYDHKEDKIRLVLDNLQVHTSQETRKYLAGVPGRFEFVFTPKHGSWLNLVEGFFSKLTRQSLKGIRVKTKSELVERIYKYFEEINDTPVVYHWKYRLDEIDPNEEAQVETLSLKKSS